MTNGTTVPADTDEITWEVVRLCIVFWSAFEKRTAYPLDDGVLAQAKKMTLANIKTNKDKFGDADELRKTTICCMKCATECNRIVDAFIDPNIPLVITADIYKTAFQKIQASVASAGRNNPVVVASDDDTESDDASADSSTPASIRTDDPPDGRLQGWLC